MLLVCLRIPQQALGGKLGREMEGQPVNVNKSEGVNNGEVGASASAAGQPVNVNTSE